MKGRYQGNRGRVQFLLFATPLKGHSGPGFTGNAPRGRDWRGPAALKWGEGRGWHLYCAKNLLAACEHSVVTEEPVVVSVD